MSTRYNKQQKIISSKYEYKYICNCNKCCGKEVDPRTQVKHANEKKNWNSDRSRKKQLKEIEARQFRYVSVRDTKREKEKNKDASKKKKRSSKQLLLKEGTKVLKLKKDTSVSEMLTELALASDTSDENEKLIIASSSRTRDDQFREPPQDEIPDMFDDDFLYNIRDVELVDDLDDDDDNTDSDDDVDSDDEDVDSDDDDADSDDEGNGESDNEGLFTAPNFDDDNNYESIELDDSLDTEIILWLFKFQQRYRVSDMALEALIKFLSNTLKLIDDMRFQEFPVSIFLAKKKLGIFQPKLRMVACTNCHKLYDSKIVTNYKVNNKLAVMHCSYEEFPNNPIPANKKLCNNELTIIKKNKNKTVAIPRMLYPKPSIKQQLSNMYQRPDFERMLKLSGVRNYNNTYYADIYDGNVWKTFPFDGSRFFSPETASTNLGLLINLDWFQPFKYTQHSTGAIYASICNLPRAERNKPENILYLGFLPGPKEVGLEKINHYLAPIVDELKELWEGWKVPQTYDNKDGLEIRVALIIGSSDIPASRKLFGHGSAIKKCHRCPVRSKYNNEYKKNYYGDIGDYKNWISQSPDLKIYRDHAQRWLQCNSRSVRDSYFKEYGVRWSELLRLPYMDPIRFAVVDPMHCLFLGVAKWIIQSIFIKENKLTNEQLHVAQRRMDDVKLPSDIGRIPPKIAIGEGFSKLTADQWKTFIMLYATTILWDMLDDDDRKILGHFVRACNLLVARFVTENDLHEAQERLWDMTKIIERTYGPVYITSNIHLSMHIPQCIRDYGSVYSFWLFPYERLNRYIGKIHYRASE